MIRLTGRGRFLARAEAHHRRRQLDAAKVREHLRTVHGLEPADRLGLEELELMDRWAHRTRARA